ncbi:MAG: macro domain-containing protein [Erysipelotrichaceae bacterium]|nr:macro domain-containing protein [Erysipelotrichaceae bacterium]
MERSSIGIRKCGITSTDADAVVNAANRHLKEGGGVCGVIFRAAGSSRLQEACDAIGGCQTGKAVITDGFDLCRYIIHAVGPIYEDGRHGEDRQLYGAYFSSLDLAREYGCRSIAFPLISSGIYGYPKEGAWEKALQACDDWIRENEGYGLEIIFTIIDDETYQMGFDIAKRLDIKVQ